MLTFAQSYHQHPATPTSTIILSSSPYSVGPITSHTNLSQQTLVPNVSSFTHHSHNPANLIIGPSSTYETPTSPSSIPLKYIPTTHPKHIHVCGGFQPSTLQTPKPYATYDPAMTRQGRLESLFIDQSPLPDYSPSLTPQPPLYHISPTPYIPKPVTKPQYHPPPSKKKQVHSTIASIHRSSYLYHPYNHQTTFFTCGKKGHTRDYYYYVPRSPSPTKKV